MSFQNHLHRLRPVSSNVYPRFHVFFLQSAFTQLGIFEGAGNKTTIPNLSRSSLAGLEVPQPPIGEQQAISAVLGQVRDAIKVQDRSLAMAQALKRAAMHTLFTRGLRGEGAEGDGDRADTGELGARQLCVSARETPIWYVGPVHVRRIRVPRASYPEHRTAACNCGRSQILYAHR